ncbi:SulP family inorganic anion transporter [Mariniblastus fucicola]|uniref:C4-dicarboxylic acid transporter DauA n=1 Tax=Mariniblastus fucicola TaxID=980251 RepID=A0A5B9P787_9BACT|nr:SulP family inorganic anion transporter [Mariniblastus fucicola]QEG21055.1 C4-dicarboxylic acid transporter DauA [Mariniblastus fucicola]
MNSQIDELNSVQTEKPVGNVNGFIKYLRYDLISGFLVFLIALPLCLGIALACGYPAIAGIFTAVVGSLVATFISDSELTIKGPAAGLIVIAIGCIESFGGDGAMGGFTEIDMQAYKLALAVGVGAAVLQILFGMFRGGILGEFFPLAAVHGMLAAIGIIIMVKQLPIALGYEGGKGEPLEMLQEIPHYIQHLNPEIALIGVIGLAIMFLWPIMQKSTAILKAVPSPLVVLLVTVPMGMYFDLLHEHGYEFNGHQYKVGESFLVQMPDRVFGMFDFITTPDFAAYSPKHLGNSIVWILMFFVIGSLESILSAKAVDVIDPWKRKTNMNRDTIAVGVGNLIASFIGGLPMISEIVRSKANIDNGARTRFANLWHGLFLLACVALLPTVLHRIPLAALAAMLIYTGFRLTHPTEFVHTYRTGPEQLIIFVATLVGVLATDLLIGIAIGIGVKMFIHLLNGVPVSSLFKPYLDITIKDDNTALVQAHKSAVFSNWIQFRSKLVNEGLNERRNVILDMSDTQLVDHSVMEKLHELESDFSDANLELRVVGLDEHKHLAEHKHSARKRAIEKLRRITIIVSANIQDEVCRNVIGLGASGYTLTNVEGVGRHQIHDAQGSLPSATRMTKIEVIVPRPIGNEIVDYCRNELAEKHPNSVCTELVEVLKKEHFVPTI